ncbi:hypothetical protein GN244_ATG08567 [Phytophthora infestans]|uniref:Uncharacterized protein n=1 Tax=Phytophthora infestans TaxID=4787 RepID=A0A833WEI0_PHYIN|nr:hypothetical protein GN244_ATG08567 [Phytophthora infestans]
MKDCQVIIIRLFTSRFESLKSSDLNWIAYLDPRVASEMNHLAPENANNAYLKLLDAAAKFALVLTSLETHPPPGAAKRAPNHVNNRMFGKNKQPTLATVPVVCTREFTAYKAACENAGCDGR